MPTSSTPCHDAFAAGQEQRRRIPLREGRYKIRDGLWRLGRFRATLELIEGRLKNGGKFREGEDLVMCTADDKGAFLKRLPADIAELTGLMILPGIAALAGDGVSPAAVAEAVKHAEDEVDWLLDRCEDVHALLKGGGIAVEYAAMRRGESHLLPLIRYAESIAHDALYLAEAADHV